MTENIVASTERDSLDFVSTNKNISVAALSRLAGIPRSSLRDELKKENSGIRAYLKLNGINNVTLWAKNGVTPIEVSIVLSFYAFNSSKDIETTAYNSLMKLNPELPLVETKNRKQIVKTEKQRQVKLAKKLNGKIEVETVAGKIDILTPTQLIEVKRVKSWKDALGQVLAYGVFYPSHIKRIHLYGETQEAYLKMIKEVAEKYHVIVTWEN